MKHTFILLVYSFILLIVSYQISNAQTGTTLNTPEATEGYTIFEINNDTYLINNCGEIINTWQTPVFGNPVVPKILPNGNLLFLNNDNVYEKDWDDNFVNVVSINESNLHLRYEVILLPSGNYLSVGRRDFSNTDFLNIGYDITFTSPDEIDVVVELDRTTGEVVWEWNIADHVIQERDASLPNYGSIADNPQLLNMDAIGTVDWTWQESFMINGMDYNPTLDQIILSVRKMGEIVIIDHSTTTAEAAGSTGGNAGKGGDILYRWGNPENYGRGTANDRILYYQHNPNWITQGEHEGKIICFNNGLDRPVPYGQNYSTVPIIDPEMDDDGSYILVDDAAFEPAIAPIEYSEVHTGTEFFSDYTSGAEVLPNENIFITEGLNSRLFEINPDGEILWEYHVPSVFYLFRAEKYSSDYIGFEGIDLNSTEIKLPGDFSTYDCQLASDTMTTAQDVLLNESAFSVVHFTNAKEIQITNTSDRDFNYSLVNLQGRQIIEQQNVSTNHRFSVDGIPSGFYVLKLIDKKTSQWFSQKIIIP